jgi:glycosyltransferase involved in cell wall biosynthesis
VAPLIGVIGRLAGVPLCVGTEHLVLTPEQMSHYRVKQWFLFGLVAIHRRALHWVISPSHYSTSIMIARFGLPAAKVYTIYHGVAMDGPLFASEPKPRPRPVFEGAGARWPVLGCVGVVEERKGQYLIVEALPELCQLFPEVSVLIVGGGDDIPALRARAQVLGVDQYVEFTGARDDVATLYRQMDVFVLPSRLEGLPIAPIEAMAHGLPVIANAISPLREVMGETGVLMTSRSAEGIVEAMRTLFALADPQSVGAAARARAEAEFRLQRMIDQTLALFEDDLACRTAGRRVH